MGVSAWFTLQWKRLGVTHTQKKRKNEKQQSMEMWKCGNVEMWKVGVPCQIYKNVSCLLNAKSSWTSISLSMFGYFFFFNFNCKNVSIDIEPALLAEK